MQVRCLSSSTGLVRPSAPRFHAESSARTSFSRHQHPFSLFPSPLSPCRPSLACRVGFLEGTSQTSISSEANESLDIQGLRKLVGKVSDRPISEKIVILEAEPSVKRFFQSRQGKKIAREIEFLPPQLTYVLLCLPALNQHHVLSILPTDRPLSESLVELADVLARNEKFYDSIGGLLGYQLKCLELIEAETRGGEAAIGATEAAHGCDTCPPPDQPATSVTTRCELNFHVPTGPDLASPGCEVEEQRLALRGLLSLPHLAEIYPLGGAGDRLGLKDEATGECLPAAMLPYCGRPLLDTLMRDLEAREYLHYRAFGVQHRTPVAIMTSDAKGNHRRVTQHIEARGFYGRGKEAFRAFRQPMVPCVSADDGRWPLVEPLRPMMKPGGHGAIWKLMHDEGVFEWLLQGQKREAALIRQISNPLAGTDATLLALAGAGHPERKSFGFASCERAVGAAEGVNVLLEKKTETHDLVSGEVSTSYSYGISNVEYTEFTRLGIPDLAREDCGAEASSSGRGSSLYPANTNILYVDLQRIQSTIQCGMANGGAPTLPGLLFNMSKTVTYKDAELQGRERTVRAGRLESTMQNIADHLTLTFPAPLNPAAMGQVLNTFVLFNRRRKTTSSAKKKRKPGSTCIHQTPDGSFFDLMRNAEEILTRCRVAHPGVGPVEAYLEQGPRFTFLFHPALGPLWSVIQQKIQGGRVAEGADVVLEVAELLWRDVEVEGALRVEAECPTGRLDAASGLRSFSDAGGRCRLENVRVVNRGVDRSDPARNEWWKGRVRRIEQCAVVLQGRSEFEARDVELRGDLTFVVPDGHRMVVTASPDARGYAISLTALEEGAGPSWRWRYGASTEEEVERGRPAICLELEEDGGTPTEAEGRSVHGTATVAASAA